MVSKADEHFVHNYHVAKELSHWLKAQDIQALHVEDPKLALRLKFYGIEQAQEPILKYIKHEEIKPGDFVLNYTSKKIAHYRITSI